MSFYENLLPLVQRAENHQIQVNIPREIAEGHLNLNLAEHTAKEVGIRITAITTQKGENPMLSMVQDDTTMTLVANEGRNPFITSRQGTTGELEDEDPFLQAILKAAA